MKGFFCSKVCLFVQLILWAIVARKVQRVLQEQLALPHCLEEQSQEEGTESKSHGRKFLLPSIKRETFFATATFPKVSGISDRTTHAPHTVQV